MGNPSLIVPDGYADDRIKQRVDNLLKTALYRLYLDKKDHEQVKQFFRKRNLQVPEDGIISAWWDKFRECEAKHPERMAQFRRQMGVSA